MQWDDDQCVYASCGIRNYSKSLSHRSQPTDGINDRLLKFLLLCFLRLIFDLRVYRHSQVSQQCVEYFQHRRTWQQKHTNCSFIDTSHTVANVWTRTNRATKFMEDLKLWRQTLCGLTNRASCRDENSLGQDADNTCFHRRRLLTVLIQMSH